MPSRGALRLRLSRIRVAAASNFAGRQTTRTERVGERNPEMRVSKHREVCAGAMPLAPPSCVGLGPMKSSGAPAPTLWSNSAQGNSVCVGQIQCL